MELTGDLGGADVDRGGVDAAAVEGLGEVGDERTGVATKTLAGRTPRPPVHMGGSTGGTVSVTSGNTTSCALSPHAATMPTRTNRLIARTLPQLAPAGCEEYTRGARAAIGDVRN